MIHPSTKKLKINNMTANDTHVGVLDDNNELTKMRCIGCYMEVQNMAGLTFEARLPRGESMWYSCWRHACIADR